MFFTWIGFLKSDVEPIPQSVQRLTTDFLSQPLIRITSAGPLRDEKGNRSAMMMIFEHDSREAAERFVSGSPYLEANLYDDSRLYEYSDEIG